MLHNNENKPAGGGKMKLRGGIHLVMVSIVILISIAFMSCSSGNGNVPTQPPTTETGPSTESGERSWKGSEGIKTDIFTITKDTWQIRWSSNPQSASGDEALFQVYVHDVKLGTFPIYIAADTKTKGNGTYDVKGSGRFYLVIDAENTNWTVEVVE